MGSVTFLYVKYSGQETKTLARGLRTRDPELLDRLIEQYQYRLFRYLLYLTGHRETAEDLFQETWLRVFERGNQYDGETKFETWLFSIARHLVIDLVRRKKLPIALEELTHPADLKAASAWTNASAGSPLDLATQGEESRRVMAALARLPAAYREVLVLRFQEDLNLEEISQVQGAPLSTVKSRLYRGLEALRDMLEGGDQ